MDDSLDSDSEGSGTSSNEDPDDATSYRQASSLPSSDDLPDHFDAELVSKHSYLGKELEETHGSTFYDEESVQLLPIVLRIGIVLFPGQILPLTVSHEPSIEMLRQVIAEDKTIGVVCLRTNLNNSLEHSEYGTTAEIIEFIHKKKELRIKARGKQRFKILHRLRLLHKNWVLPGRVKILSENVLLCVLPELRTPSFHRYRKNKNLSKRFHSMDIAVAPWPKFVLDNFDVKEIGPRVLKQLKLQSLIPSYQGAPTNVVELSYWVARVLPVGDTQRLNLLAKCSALERLLYAMELLAKGSMIRCAYCSRLVSSCKNIISTSLDGPTGIYCNPGGHIFDIITLDEVEGLMIYSDPPNTEFSWFPGYGWTIATCGCQAHLGWLFTAVNENLTPRTFWGLRKNCVSMANNPRCCSLE